MELKTAIEILERHQEWRRDQNVPAKTQMQKPIEIGKAIDYVIKELKKLREVDIVGQTDQPVCDYCNDDAKPSCCDKCLKEMVNPLQQRY